MTTRLKISFGDVYMGFHQTDYLFKHLFRQRYDAVETDDDPDIVFFNHKKRRYNKFQNTSAIKVLVTGEVQHKNHHPNDFSFSFDNTDNTNFYLPGFVRFKEWFEFIEQTKSNKYEAYPKNKFCHFIYTNAKAQERIVFCNTLMKYKHVDCPGPVLNNMPNFTNGGRKDYQWRNDKLAFTKPYKFAIAYENVAAESWITEKIFHPYYTGSIPIYWGAPDIDELFNPDSFIHARNFTNDKELVEYIEEVDNNDNLYADYRIAPMLRVDSRMQMCTKEKIFKRFDKIVDAARKR